MAIETITRQELLENMRRGGSEFVAAARAVPEQHWAEGRYEDGWTARDILAHVASIEWTYPKLFLLAEQAAADPAPEALDAERSFRGGVGDYNQRQVAKRADATVGELIEEFERNRATTIAAVEEADADLFAVRIRSAGGVEGTAAEVLNYVAVIHVEGHLRDLKGESS
jgi:hypothetical protein